MSPFGLALAASSSLLGSFPAASIASSSFSASSSALVSLTSPPNSSMSLLNAPSLSATSSEYVPSCEMRPFSRQTM